MGTTSQSDIHPTSGKQRFGAIDSLRGFALLGILGPNIVAFSQPMNAMTDPNVIGDTPANHLAHTITTTVFLGKFMFLFALLFGSGVIMYARKYDQRELGDICARCGYPMKGLDGDVSCPECNCPDRKTKKHKLSEGATLWYIRCCLLLMFGMIHAYCFWYGDILTFYAISGLTALWWIRRLNPKLLFFGGMGLYFFGSLLLIGFSFLGYNALSQGQTTVDSFGANPDVEIAGYTGTYIEAFKVRFFSVLFMQLVLGIFFQPILWGIMAMGMGLTKMKILTGERSLRFYAIWALVLLGAGIPMTAIGYSLVHQHFTLLPGFIWQSMAQPIGVPIALGYGTLILALTKCDWARFVTTPLAAVGRMALSNYFLQTFLCTTIFYGYGIGFGLFAQLEYPMIWLVVLGVWSVNIIFSMLWLRVFVMGPFEWVWRVLTYRQLVPIVRRSSSDLPIGTHNSD